MEQHIRQSCILWIYITAVWKARKLLNRAGWLSSAEPTIHRISASKSFKLLLKCSLSLARCIPTEQYPHQMHSDNSSYLQLQLAPSERQSVGEEDNGWGGRRWEREATPWIGKLCRITSALHSSDGKSGQSLSITGANSHPPTQGSGKYSTAGSFSPFLRCNVVFTSLQGRPFSPSAPLLQGGKRKTKTSPERFGNVLFTAAITTTQPGRSPHRSSSHYFCHVTTTGVIIHIISHRLIIPAKILCIMTVTLHPSVSSAPTNIFCLTVTQLIGC